MLTGLLLKTGVPFIRKNASSVQKNLIIKKTKKNSNLCNSNFFNDACFSVAINKNILSNKLECFYNLRNKNYSLSRKNKDIDYKLPSFKDLSIIYTNENYFKCSLSERNNFPYELNIKTPRCPIFSEPIYLEESRNFIEDYIHKNQIFQSKKHRQAFCEMDIGITGHIGGDNIEGVMLSAIHHVGLLYRDTVMGSLEKNGQFTLDFKRDDVFIQELNKKITQTLGGYYTPKNGDNKMLIVSKDVYKWTNKYNLDIEPYIKAMNRYFQSEKIELQNKAHKIMPTLETMFYLKSDMGFSPTCAEIALLGKKVSLSDEERNNTVYKSYTDVGGLLISLANDLYSLFKEMKDQDANNYVLVIMKENDCSLREALDIAVNIFNKKMEAFFELKELLPESDNFEKAQDAWEGTLYYTIRWCAHTHRYSSKYKRNDEDFLKEYSIYYNGCHKKTNIVV